MLLLRCVTAYLALCQLMEAPMPFSQAHQMVVLKQALSPHVDFYLQEEQKLIAQYGKKNAAGGPVFQANGRLEFAKAADAPEYARRHRELDLVEVAWIPMPMQPPETIKPVQAEALLGIVTFTGGGAHGRAAKNAESG